MGDDLKYIIVKINGAEVPNIFSNLMGHMPAAHGFRAISDTP